MMGLATVEIRHATVLKDYKDHPDGPTRWGREIHAYTELAWATPRLLWHNEYWLETERLTPILDLGPDASRKYQEPLRALLERLHSEGWNHCDVDLVNVVVHPVRGPLLIDWESVSPASGDVSYDLYGARAAGVEPRWDGKGPDGVFWSSRSETTPKNYWG